MADIILTCESCGTTLTLSEYAKPDKLSCPKCAKPMLMPVTDKGSVENLLPEHVRKAKAEAQAAQAVLGDVPAVHLSDISKNIHNIQRRRRRIELIVPTLKAIGLFLLLTLLFGYIRYFEGWKLFLDPVGGLDQVRFAGFIAVLFFHLVIVIEAMTDEFVTGLLCLLVPGYSLYYLFTVSDSFWLRAITLSLIIVFGHDFAMHVHAYAMDFYRFVNAWLEAGGTPEPTTRLK